MNEDLATEVQELRVTESPDGNENLLVGGLTGLAAAIAGAGTWAAITVYTNYQIGFMAVGVGYLVGLTMRKFGHGHSSLFGGIAAILAVLGCVTGNLLSACAFAADELQVSLGTILKVLSPSAALGLLQEGFSPIDALFYFLAVSAAFRTSRNAG